MRKFSVAVVQFKIKQFDPETNIQRATSFIKKASKAGADMIVFPEDFLCGPILRRPDLDDRSGKYVKAFVGLAKENAIDIIPGTIIERRGSRRVNISYYINKKGEISGRYEKMHLWIPERRYLSSGNTVAVFNTSYGKVGLAICWDLAFGDLFRAMVRKGARIVICPSWWAHEDGKLLHKYNKECEVNLVNSLCISRAMENGIVLIYCNASGKAVFGKTHLYNLIGQSQVAIPVKGILKRFNHNKEEMMIVEVDAQQLLTM